MKIESAVFELSAALECQLPPSSLPEIAFSGRSNVGKSSLINRLLNRKNLARTSATPGKTATVNFYRLDTLRLVDLPGYGYAKVARAEKERWNRLINGYLMAERDLRLVIQLVDMRHPASADDEAMIDFMVNQSVPFVLVLTKADKLNKTQRQQRLSQFSEQFADLEGVRIVPFSALTGEGIPELRGILDEVLTEEPEADSASPC